MRNPWVIGISVLLSNMIVSEILSQHICDYGSMVISVNYYQLTTRIAFIDDVADKTSSLAAFHTMYVSNDYDVF